MKRFLIKNIVEQAAVRDITEQSVYDGEHCPRTCSSVHKGAGALASLLFVCGPRLQTVRDLGDVLVVPGAAA